MADEATFSLESGLWGKYLQANAKFPIRTAVATSAVLWTVGDGISQVVERQTKPGPYDRARLFGTCVSKEALLVVALGRSGTNN